MIYVGLILLAIFGVALQVWALVGDMVRLASGCLCRKGAVNAECPLHGRRS